GAERSEPSFLHAAWLYHPDTVIRSLVHDGSGPEPGFKDKDGKWDLRPHRQRIIRVDRDVLRTWNDVLEEGRGPDLESRMVYTVNQSASTAMQRLAESPRIGEIGLEYS